MNDLLQWAAVVLVLAFAIIWIIRRLRKKPSDSPCSSCSGCSGCELANCDKGKIKEGPRRSPDYQKPKA